MIAARIGRSPDQVRRRRRELLGPGKAGRRYGREEDEAIQRCVQESGDLVALAYRLGRSPDSVRLHAQLLGLHHPAPRRRWAVWEDVVILDGYTSALPCAEIARQLPHRSPTSVAARARKLGLVSYARRWSPLEDQRLIQLTARGGTLENIAQRLGRTPEAIRRHAAHLGIDPPPPAPAPRRARRWTSGEDELLRLHQALNPARLAELLGRSDTAVCRRLCALGLRARAQRSPHHPGGRRPDRSVSRRERSARLSDAARLLDDGRRAPVGVGG